MTIIPISEDSPQVSALLFVTQYITLLGEQAVELGDQQTFGPVHNVQRHWSTPKGP